MDIKASAPQTYYDVKMTLEELHALGIALDKVPTFPQPLEGTIEGIWDKIDPILCENFGNFWDQQ